MGMVFLLEVVSGSVWIGVLLLLRSVIRLKPMSADTRVAIALLSTNAILGGLYYLNMSAEWTCVAVHFVFLLRVLSLDWATASTVSSPLASRGHVILGFLAVIVQCCELACTFSLSNVLPNATIVISTLLFGVLCCTICQLYTTSTSFSNTEILCNAFVTTSYNSLLFSRDYFWHVATLANVIYLAFACSVYNKFSLTAKENTTANNVAVTELLRYISHSLRSPLHTLHAGLSTLTGTSPAQEGTVDDMRLAADAASRVLDDIVNYHELVLRLGLKSRPPSPAKTKVNLTHVLQSSIARHTHHATQQQVNMVLSSHQFAVYTYSDADKLHYIINVIISAAVDISPAMTTVLIKTTCSNSMALVEITDSSHGMKEKVAQDLMHSYNLLLPDATHCMGPIDCGTGLASGLSLWACGSLVKILGGDMDISTSSTGNTFRLRLPASFPSVSTENISTTDNTTTTLSPLSSSSSSDALTEKPTVAILRSSRSSTVTTGPSSSPRCLALVVDDVLSNRRLLGRMIQHRFSDVHFATNGLEAVEMMEKILTENDAYAAVFMDCNMPVMSGMEASEKIRGLGYTGPIIGVTGNALEEDRLAFINSGVNVVLTKPATKATLDDILNEFM